MRGCDATASPCHGSKCCMPNPQAQLLLGCGADPLRRDEGNQQAY